MEVHTIGKLNIECFAEAYAKAVMVHFENKYPDVQIKVKSIEKKEDVPDKKAV